MDEDNCIFGSGIGAVPYCLYCRVTTTETNQMLRILIQTQNVTETQTATIMELSSYCEE